MKVKFRRAVGKVCPELNHHYVAGFDDKLKASTVVIAEAEPCRRTVLCARNAFGGHITLPFPYVQFVLTYPTGRFQYTSVYSRALQVYFTTEPLRLESDFKLSYSPLETVFGGTACLRHDYDGTQFDTEEELLNFAVGTWWTSGHFIAGHHSEPEIVQIQYNWRALPDPLKPGVWDDPKLWPCPGFRTLKSAVYGLSPGRIEDE